jgi:hypothetical protein
MKVATGWLCNEEKLLALIVLDDGVAARLSDRAGQAFFRAFIVQNRATGRILMRFRFRYTDHDAWFKINPKEQGTARHHLRENITGMLLEGAKTMGNVISPLAVEVFEPPDDEGDFDATIRWLDARDLITITRVELPEVKPQ